MADLTPGKIDRAALERIMQRAAELQAVGGVFGGFTAAAGLRFDLLPQRCRAEQ